MLHTLPPHTVHYPTVSAGRSISEPAAEAFRSAASRLVGQLDAESRARRGRAETVEWKRLKVIIEDSEADRTPWIAGMGSMLRCDANTDTG